MGIRHQAQQPQSENKNEQNEKPTELPNTFNDKLKSKLFILSEFSVKSEQWFYPEFWFLYPGI